MITYLAQLDSSIFVMDYDHNADSPEHLAQTHPRALQIIWQYKPDLPVIMISKPDILLNNEDDIKRRDIIFSTYSRAGKAEIRMSILSMATATLVAKAVTAALLTAHTPMIWASGEWQM